MENNTKNNLEANNQSDSNNSSSEALNKKDSKDQQLSKLENHKKFNSEDAAYKNRRPGFRNKRQQRQKKQSKYQEKVVSIRRVTKVTKGGRNFKFATLVVIGDGKGKVGYGTGKANEVPDSIKKAITNAEKNLFDTVTFKTTVPHEVIGHFGASKILIKPAGLGRGVIAGGIARTVMELAGIKDVYTKSLGSNTPINLVKATLDGLKQMKTKKYFDYIRDLNVSPDKKIQDEKTLNQEGAKDETTSN